MKTTQMFSVPGPQSTVTVLSSLPSGPILVPHKHPPLSWPSPETHPVWAHAQPCALLMPTCSPDISHCPWCPDSPACLYLMATSQSARNCDCHHSCPLRLGSQWTPALPCLGHPAPCWSDCSSSEKRYLV